MHPPHNSTKPYFLMHWGLLNKKSTGNIENIGSHYIFCSCFRLYSKTANFQSVCAVIFVSVATPNTGALNSPNTMNYISMERYFDADEDGILHDRICCCCGF